DTVWTMRLTVGPLPSAVYWRRRLVVLGGAGLVALIIVYAFTGGPDGSSAAPATTAAAGNTHPGPAPRPATPPPPPHPPPPPTPTPTPSAFPLPAADPTGPCTDAELQLTASANPADLTVGQGATFTLTIKNISNRTCTRDIGSAPQELQLKLGDKLVWSSD